MYDERQDVDHGKMDMYIRGDASGAKMNETLRALVFACAKYEGQLRKKAVYRTLRIL